MSSTAIASGAARLFLLTGGNCRKTPENNIASPLKDRALRRSFGARRHIDSPGPCTSAPAVLATGILTHTSGPRSLRASNQNCGQLGSDVAELNVESLNCGFRSAIFTHHEKITVKGREWTVMSESGLLTTMHVLRKYSSKRFSRRTSTWRTMKETHPTSLGRDTLAPRPEAFLPSFG